MSKLPVGLTAKLYAFSFFDDLVLIYPLSAVLFQDSGLNALQISSLFIVWSLTIFLLEIPSGSLADKFPRKNILLLAAAAKIIGFGFWLFMPTYAGFLIGFIFWGIKVALTSGTREALVYDELKRSKSLPFYTQVMGKMESFELLGIILASLGASLLASRGYRLILILSIVSVALSAVVLSLFPNVPKAAATTKTKYLDYLKEGVHIVFQKPILMFFVLFMGILTGLGAADEYFSLVFREKGLSNTYIALWISIIYAFGIVGSLLAHRLDGKKRLLEAAIIIGAVLLLGTALAPSILSPLMAGLYMGFLYAGGVLFNTYLQKHATDKTRATTTSVGGIVSEGFAICTILLITLGANKVNYSYGIGLSAVSVVCIGIVLAIYARKLKPLG